MTFFKSVEDNNVLMFEMILKVDNRLYLLKSLEYATKFTLYVSSPWLKVEGQTSKITSN